MPFKLAASPLSLLRAARLVCERVFQCTPFLSQRTDLCHQLVAFCLDVVRAAIVRFLLLATVGVRTSCDLQSGVSRKFTYYDSNVCDIAPRVLEKCLVHALSALVENMKVLIGC